MLLDNFYTKHNDQITVSQQQASQFAKTIADDYNPIHDPCNPRFCVPGDLLFSLVLQNSGLSQDMTFTFTGMVGDDVGLIIPETDAGSFAVTDTDGKEYLTVERSGSTTQDAETISEFSENYVAFSGKNFPDIIVPLMAAHNVMINPSRPLVIYQSMSVHLDTIHLTHPTLELTETTLDVNGKKATAHLNFCIKSAGKVVGKGVKKLTLRGLVAYDEAVISAFVEDYLQHKKTFKHD